MTKVDSKVCLEDEDFASKLIPARVLYQFSKTFNRQTVAGANAALVAQLESLLTNVAAMYEADYVDGWTAFLDQLLFGCIIETKNYGTSSVSQGLAVEHFTENPDEHVVAIANCGTGGLKCQVAIQRPLTLAERQDPASHATLEIVQILFECNSDLCISKLKLGSYVPEAGASTVETQQKKLVAACKRLRVELDKRGFTQKPFRILTVITGPVRNAWEKFNYFQEAMQMEVDAQAFFSCENDSGIEFVPFQESFFMPVATEADFEQQAVESMYENIRLAGKFLNLDKPLEIVHFCAMERGNSQLGNTDCEMDTPTEVLLRTSFRLTVEDQYTYINHMKQLCKTPVIALKSGFALLLENNTFGPILRKQIETLQS